MNGSINGSFGSNIVGRRCFPTYDIALSAYPTAIDSTVVRTCLGVLFALIMITGFLGNFAVLYGSFTKKVGLDIKKYFVVSLAAADLTVCLLALPTTVVTTFVRKWFFGTAMCRTVAFLQAASIFYSSFTFMAIAIDRYFLVVYPGAQQCSLKLISMGQIALFLGSIALAAPLIFTMKITRPGRACYDICIEFWKDFSGSRRVYTVVSFLLQFVMPIFVTCACYMAIVLKVRRQFALRKQHEVLLETAKARIRTRKTRTMVMSTIMVGSFVIFWLPLNVYNMNEDYRLIPIDSDSTSLVKLICYAIAMCSTMSNPIIYSWFHEQFRRRIICRVFQRCGKPKMTCVEQPTVRRTSRIPEAEEFV